MATSKLEADKADACSCIDCKKWSWRGCSNYMLDTGEVFHYAPWREERFNDAKKCKGFVKREPQS